MFESTLGPWLLAVAAALVLLATTLYLHHRMLKVVQVVDRTANAVDTFAETSVAMGAAVQQLLHPGPVANRAPTIYSSRRLLLQQARAQLQEGVPAAEVATQCGLIEDEVRLLGCLGGGRYSTLA